MAIVVLVLEDAAEGIVDLAVHVNPKQPLGPVDLPDDSAAVRIGRRMVFVAQATAAKSNHKQPQED